MPPYLTRIECPPPKNQKVILHSGKIQYMPLYLTRIEGPPPKRDVVRSSRARGAIIAVICKNYGTFLFIITSIICFIRLNNVFSRQRIFRKGLERFFWTRTIREVFC